MAAVGTQCGPAGLRGVLSVMRGLVVVVVAVVVIGAGGRAQAQAAGDGEAAEVSLTHEMALRYTCHPSTQTSFFVKMWDYDTVQLEDVDAGDCLVKRETGQVYCLPVFAIVGTQKGGTTLTQNRLVSPCLSSSGETHYFDHIHSEEQLRKHWKEYTHEFQVPRDVLSTGRIPIFVDKSPNYTMLTHNAADYAAMVAPSMKAVMSIRNPPDRMYSGFHQQCRAERYRKHPTEDRMLFCSTKHGIWPDGCDKGEIYRAPCAPSTFYKHIHTYGAMENNWHDWNHKILQDWPLDPANLFHRSYYLPQIRNWVRKFPNEQLLLIFNDDLAADTHGALDLISEHAGIPPPPLPSLTDLMTIGGHYTFYQPMDAPSRKALDGHFCPHNAALQRMLGMPLPSRWACAEGVQGTRAGAGLGAEGGAAHRRLRESSEGGSGGDESPENLAWTVKPVVLPAEGTEPAATFLVARLLPSDRYVEKTTYESFRGYVDTSLSTPKFLVTVAILLGCCLCCCLGSCLYYGFWKLLRTAKPRSD